MKKLIIAACIALSGCSTLVNTIEPPVTATTAEGLPVRDLRACAEGEAVEDAQGNFYAANATVCSAELDKRAERYREELARQKAADEKAKAEAKKAREEEERREAPIRAAEQAKAKRVCGVFANDMRIKYHFGAIKQIDGNSLGGSDTWMCRAYYSDLVGMGQHFAMMQVNPSNGAYRIMAAY